MHKQQLDSCYSINHLARLCFPCRNLVLIPLATSSLLPYRLFAPYEVHLNTIYRPMVVPLLNINSLYFSAVFVIACWRSFHWISTENVKLFCFIKCALLLYPLQWKVLNINKSFIKTITTQWTLVLFCVCLNSSRYTCG